MKLHGADNADLATGSEVASSAASDAGEEVGAATQNMAALTLAGQMTAQHKGKKPQSTAGGSTAPTTVGNSTAAGTFTSAASTAGGTDDAEGC